MGRKIVIQPDGKYAMWSSIVNDFLTKDMTEEQFKKFYSEEAYKNEMDRLNNLFDYIKTNHPRKQNWTKDYKECMEIKKSLE